MSLVINTNNIATIAAGNLHANQTSLQKSLARLSSGSKITTPSDDAGGLAVSTKLKAAIHRNIRAQQNVDNAISFLQTQDGALKVATGILDRISELKTMSLDPTKNALDIATYNTEFKELQQQLTNISKEQFNGIDLFNKFSDLTVHTTEDGVTGLVNASRGGLFEDLNIAELSQKAIASTAYVGTDGTDYTTLTFTTPTHGLTTDVILADGALNGGVAGSVNGSDISAAIKGINDALAAAGISTISASEDSDGKLVITGSETFTVAEATTGAFVATGLAGTYDGVAKTYDYNALADYRVGDVVSGERSDGSQESFLITNTNGVTGNGRTFDDFAALEQTTRLNNSVDPNAQVYGGATTSFDAGDVVYNDEDGRYYLSRGDGTYANNNTGAINAGATGRAEFLALGNSLPGLTDHADYSAGVDYFKDDIVSYDGNLYVATTTITEAEGSPLDNTGEWVKLSVSVSGSKNLMDLDNDLADFSVTDLRAMIQTAATSRAQNGAEMSRLEVSNEMLATNHTNLEASNSRLEDVDVASESTAFARANILVQSAAAMLAQANTSQSVALSLLQ